MKWVEIKAIDATDTTIVYLYIQDEERRKDSVQHTSGMQSWWLKKGVEVGKKCRIATT